MSANAAFAYCLLSHVPSRWPNNGLQAAGGTAVVFCSVAPSEVGARSAPAAERGAFGCLIPKVEQIQREMHMLDLNQLKLQYITDKTGEKTAVILPIQEFQELLEDIEDLAVVAERREEPCISHDELLAELRRDGLL
jgi:hypothetical protein